MLFKLIQEGKENAFQPYLKRDASELNLSEKELETWMAENPELLFGTERVLVISQSVSGQSMGDILALDADGRLVIVEIKRDWSNRATVGQILEYAAEMTGKCYEDLEKLHHSYWIKQQSNCSYASLLKRFQTLTDNHECDEDDIPRRQKGHRILIVAPAADEGLMRIVEWLREYGVPISFVPFTIHADTESTDILLELEPLLEAQSFGEIVENRDWRGDWIFNTNETYAPGAYRKMFDQGVIAIHGYESGPANLTGSAEGQRVFAYVNRKGVLAVGSIVNGRPIPGTTVFGEDREFHVKVVWETVVDDDKGITLRDVSENKGYNLPVRCVFARMYRHDAADWIAEELQRRS